MVVVQCKELFKKGLHKKADEIRNVAQSIVETVRQRGGKFLKRRKCTTGRAWIDIGDVSAVAKTKREMKTELAKLGRVPEDPTTEVELAKTKRDKPAADQIANLNQAQQEQVRKLSELNPWDIKAAARVITIPKCYNISSKRSSPPRARTIDGFATAFGSASFAPVSPSCISPVGGVIGGENMSKDGKQLSPLHIPFNFNGAKDLETKQAQSAVGTKSGTKRKRLHPSGDQNLFPKPPNVHENPRSDPVPEEGPIGTLRPNPKLNPNVLPASEVPQPDTCLDGRLGWVDHLDVQAGPTIRHLNSAPAAQG